MIYGIIFPCAIVLAALLSVFCFVPKLKWNKDLLKFRAREDDNFAFYTITKIGAALIFALFLYRVWYNEVFEQIVNKDGLFAPNTIVMMVIFRAMLTGSIFLLIVSPWFNYRPFQYGAAVCGTVSYIINIIYFKQNIQAMLGIVKIPTYQPREIMFVLELIFGFALCLLYLVKKILDKDYLDFKKIPVRALLTLFFFFFFSVIIMNPYSLGNVTDLSDWSGIANDFSKDHILLIFLMFLFTIIFSIIFRNVKDKMYLHCFLALGSLICFINYMYIRDYGHFAYWKLPFHLCNTGVFLMLVSFTIKNKPIFYFTYLINISGTLFAIFLPDYEQYIFSATGIDYWNNHIILFMLPIIAVAGGFYERPKLKYVWWATIVFAIYFFVVGTMDAAWQDQVNYFFLNGDSIVERFVWAPHLKHDYIVYFTIGNTNFRVYWLYWMLVFIFYIGFILATWFIYASLYKLSDGYADLIKRTIAKSKEKFYLKKEMNGRDISEPLHPENAGKVVISHFTKIYDGDTRKAVDDFSLEINPGTVYGFLGHNGAGKSTTIKSLVGIQTITSGTIEINGYDIVRQPVEAKMEVGYVSDNHTVYEHLTGREYINYVADLYMVKEEDRDARIAKYAKMFMIEDAIDREIKGYSHGMKQKIVVIASLIHAPKVWVLDEPLTGLDPTSSHQIKTIMKEYAEEGNIVFFSSHVIEVVEKICDSICIINGGKLVGTWNIKDLASEGLTLQDLYVKYVSFKGINADGIKESYAKDGNNDIEDVEDNEVNEEQIAEDKVESNEQAETEEISKDSEEIEENKGDNDERTE